MPVRQCTVLCFNSVGVDLTQNRQTSENCKSVCCKWIYWCTSRLDVANRGFFDASCHLWMQLNQTARCSGIVSKPCCPTSPSQLSSPQRQPARKLNVHFWYFHQILLFSHTCAYWSTVAPGWIASGPWGTILGACQPPTSVHSIISMWSVKAVPNLRPSSTGFAFLFFTSCTSTTTLWRWAWETDLE